MVGRAQGLVRAEREHGMLLAQGDEALHPAQERGRRAQLRLDVDGLEAVDGIHQRRRIELREVRAREAAVPVAGPVHRRADAVAVAEVDVVAHADLVAVVEDRAPGEREEDRRQQLDLVAAVVEQRREPAADAEVEPHVRVLRVLRPHVVALVLADHLERQLVVVSQEEPPLGVRRDRRRLVDDVEHERRVLAPDRHEQARHDRELECHVALVAVSEVVDDIRRPLVRLGEQHPVRVVRVDLGPDALEEGVSLGQVLAVRPVALEEVRHGIEAEAVDPELEPEAEDVEHRLLHLGVVVVEVGLVGEEAVPVVLPGDRVPRPVGHLGVDEDDPHVRVAVVRIRPDVPVALRRGRVRARLLEPGVVARGVVHDEVGDHADAAPVRRVDERVEVLDGAVVGMDRVEVGDVVAAVAERRRVHRQQPDAIDAEPLEVVELVGQAAEVALAVVVSVREAADVDLVEDRALEPQRVGLEPVAAARSGRVGPPESGRRPQGGLRLGVRASESSRVAVSGRAGRELRRARGGRSCPRSANRRSHP